MKFDPTPFAHLVITDSGIGGLWACAGIERALRRSVPRRGALLTYFNAWPNDGTGYNDMPDIDARARVFDRALNRMAALAPDRIVIACNTLSILYERTAYGLRAADVARGTAVPVLGIVDAGVDLLTRALTADPGSAIVLMGTRTTIESGVHRDRLLRNGIEPGRIATVACHGLARAIETDAGADAIADLVQGCAAAAARAGLSAERLLLGLCCTHYSYISDDLCTALQRTCGREVKALDPNGRLVEQALSEEGAIAEQSDIGSDARKPPAEVTVRVLSKVEMSERGVRTIAGRIAPVSPATADALLSYTRVPDLF